MRPRPGGITKAVCRVATPVPVQREDATINHAVRATRRASYVVAQRHKIVRTLRPPPAADIQREPETLIPGVENICECDVVAGGPGTSRPFGDACTVVVEASVVDDSIVRGTCVTMSAGHLSLDLVQRNAQNLTDG